MNTNPEKRKEISLENINKVMQGNHLKYIREKLNSRVSGRQEFINKAEKEFYVGSSSKRGRYKKNQS